MKQLMSSNGQTDGQLELPYISTDEWERYATWVATATDDRAWNYDPLIYALSGLATEGGECGAFVEKWLRYGGEYVLDREKIISELGDIYYYFTLACKVAGYTPEFIAKKNKEKLIDRQRNGKK